MNSDDFLKDENAVILALQISMLKDLNGISHFELYKALTVCMDTCTRILNTHKICLTTGKSLSECSECDHCTSAVGPYLLQA